MSDKFRILVVDDDPVQREIAARDLGAAGFEVIEAARASDTLSIANAHRPDIVLLSLALADGSSHTLLEDLKANSALCGTTVILVSREGQTSEERVEGLKRGADDVLTRPLVARELIARVQSHIESHQAQAALQREAETYRMVAEFAADWIYWTMPDGKLRYVAPVCECISGYGPEAFQKRPSLLRDIVFEEDKASWDEHCRHSHEGQSPHKIEFRITRRDGRIVWLEHVCRPVLDEHGRFLGIRANNRDITERKQAEWERGITLRLLSEASGANDLRDLLKDITSLLQRLSGVAAVGLRLRNGDDYPYFETHGFPPEFVEGETHLCAADSRGRLLRNQRGDPVLECMCGKILRGGVDPGSPLFTEQGSFWTNSTSDLAAAMTATEKPTRGRYRCQAAGYESVALIPLRASGETLGLLQFNDRRKGAFSARRIELFERVAYNVAAAVAEHKAVQALRASEEKLRRQHERLAEAQRIAHLGSWDWDIARNELSWSDEVYRIFGLQPQEFGATYDAFLASVHVDDREAVEQAVKRALTDSASHYRIEHRVMRPDGANRVVREQGRVTFDADGRPVHMIGTVHDITEQHAADQKLRNALEKVEELKDRLRAENTYLQEEIKGSHGFDEIVGESEPLRVTLTRIEHVAKTDASVLLLGETGTGKELFARTVHNLSSRNDHPLVKVNCAALPSSLIESELFGHVKGAFTGAVSDKVGRFELADGGTLFLDEIGELDPKLQTKLLHVLQEGEFEKIGSAETLKVDVRVIAATNRDLGRSVEEGAFRPDLYYRLAVFPIEIPPLRQRRGDIPMLAWHFLMKKRARLGKPIDTIPPDVLTELMQYDWPGNIRELENVIERAMILSAGPALQLSESLEVPSKHRVAAGSSSSLEEIDRTHIIDVLRECDWKVKGTNNAADRLGLTPSTLRYRMRKLGIERPPRRPR
ncbi:MAG: sigma 54-interacting transcriptional regulator [Planctomycetota bacterium]